MTRQGPILVALDFSEESHRVLEFAEKSAEKSNRNLLLMHAAGRGDPVRQRPPVVLTDPLDDCARAITRISAERISALMLNEEPIRGILQAAAMYRCPIIIMGRGGTPEQPGPIASAIQQTFRGEVYLISRFKTLVYAV